MSELTKAELDALAELVEKATPGRYVLSTRADDEFATIIVGADTGRAVAVAASPRYGKEPFVKKDGPLIVALRNAAPALIAAARREEVYREALTAIAANAGAEAHLHEWTAEKALNRAGGGE